jgi:hypothetical protein
MKNYLCRNRITGQFAARHIDTLELPTYWVLSLAAHRLFARIEIELAQHGGSDNGKSPIRYEQFVEYGLDRHSVTRAIHELSAPSMAEVTEKSQAGNADFRRPNLFRLTYRHVGRDERTHEWRRINTEDETKKIAKVARLGNAQTPRWSGRRQPADVCATESV